MLTGIVDGPFQRASARQAAEDGRGVTDITDKIVIQTYEVGRRPEGRPPV